jgi:hypothetical protein
MATLFPYLNQPKLPNEKKIFNEDMYRIKSWKALAIIFIVLFLGSVCLNVVQYILRLQDQINLLRDRTPIVKVVQSSVTPTPFIATNSSTMDFSKKQVDLSKKFFFKKDYPQAVTTISDDQLAAMHCTQNYFVYGGGSVLLNPTVKIFLNQIQLPTTEKLVSLLRCTIENGKSFLVYNVTTDSLAGAGIYYSEILDDVLTSPKLLIPNMGSPYSMCVQPLFLTKTNNLYIECEGGDVGSFKDIYKVNVDSPDAKEIYYCEQLENSPATCK